MATARATLTPRPVTSPAIYARVSTHDQDHAMQLREGREWIARMGYPTAVEYVDHGVSGAKKSRPSFDRMMKACRDGKHDLIWVSKIDRLGRSMIHLLDTLTIFDELTVRFVAPGQHIDTDNSSPMGQFTVQILAALAQFERALILERSRDGRMERFAQDQPDSWCLIFGFKRGKPEIEPKHQEMIQQFADWRDADYSWYEIAAMTKEYAAKLGVNPPRGKQWWASSIAKWIKSRQCIGEYLRKPSKDKAAKLFPLPLLLDPVQWARINAKSNKRGRGNPLTKYPLTGILLGRCGKPANGYTDQHGRRRYRCEGNQQRSKLQNLVRCRCPFPRADRMEDTVFDAIWEYLMQPEHAWSFAKALVDEQNATKPNAGRDARAELEAALAEEKRVLRMTRAGMYDEVTGAAEVLELRRKITDLYTEIRALGKIVEMAPRNQVIETFRALTEGGKPEGDHRWPVLDGILDLVARMEGDEVVITGRVPVIKAENKGDSGPDKCSDNPTHRSICTDPIPFILRAKLAA